MDMSSPYNLFASDADGGKSTTPSEIDTNANNNNNAVKNSSSKLHSTIINSEKEEAAAAQQRILIDTFIRRIAAMSSWVTYLPDHPFPIQNLPYGVFTSPANEVPHIATAIGDFVVDLYELSVAGAFAFDASVAAALKETTLNTFMGLGYDKWKATREAIAALLTTGCPTLEKDLELRAKVLIPSDKATMHLAATIGDYTDFYASKEHASNLGKLFRPGQPPLMDNWLTIPVGYHGRASSVVVSGTPLRRPVGQRKPDADKPPVVGATMAFDIELEMAAWIGTGNKLGDRISTEEARKSIFGYSLFNDWSARDIQRYEYVPLGPFLGKNFGSTIGAWIVTSFALEPFLVAGPAQDPAPLPYLVEEKPGNYNVNLYVTLKTKEGESQLISTTNYKYMYWSAHQMVAHHTINGCNLRAGDVLASGTISGPTPGSYGSLLEITWQGTQPIKLPSGAERKMLQDGDTIALAGECVGDGYRIGFGECVGTVLPALPIA